MRGRVSFLTDTGDIKMEKYAWKAEIIDGKRNEYVRRHDEIWQEMKDTLKRAGIKKLFHMGLRQRTVRILRMRIRRGIRREDASRKPRRQKMERIYERRDDNAAR